ncbi:MAG: alpha/beta hydrolase, partial [Bacteroidaceae bacterium]|nr:alpha/beta hydrolase [Bacteroidaceae bacterium]
MNRKVVISILGGVLVVVVLLVVVSNYMLNYSLRPDADVVFSRENAWEGMFKNYPDMRAWRDSLNACGALHDTVVVREDGIRLHAYYIPAAQVTD